MLASLLPGLRDLRTPLATGYLYFLLGWLLLGGARLLPETPSNTFVSRIFDLSGLIGAGATLATLSFAAYLVGSILVVHKVDRPHFALKLLKADAATGVEKLMLWIAQQVDTLEATGLTARDFMGRPDLPQLFKHQFRDAYEHTMLDPTREENRFFLELSEDDREKYKLHRALSSALQLAVTNDHEALITRMQIERETLYNDYDRLRSEAELRFSIATPLVLLVLTATLQWSTLALFALVLPAILLAQAVRIQARADERVRQALITGVIRSPTIEQLMASLANSDR